MSVFAKMLFDHNKLISEYELMYWRGLSMLLFNYIYIRRAGITVLSLPKKYRCVMLCRAIMGFGGL